MVNRKQKQMTSQGEESHETRVCAKEKKEEVKQKDQKKNFETMKRDQRKE